MATSAAALSLTESLLYFTIFFCVGRMTFAGPFDLGIYGAINNWFVRQRGVATSVSTAALMFGLVCMPLIAQMHSVAGDDNGLQDSVRAADTQVVIGSLADTSQLNGLGGRLDLLG